MADSAKKYPAGAGPASSPASPAARRDAAAFAQDHGLRSIAEDGGLYKLLVESVRDYAIFALDATGHILSWNPGAQRFKGYTASEIIGKHFSIFYPQVDKDARKPERELEVATAEGSVEDEGWRIRKDGSRFWAYVVITALRNEAGELVGFAKVTRDLTERKMAEERAIADAQRLAETEATSRAKSDFLAAMSHELRTPLNAIGGYAELLSMGVAGDVTVQQRDFLERIRRSQQHLLALINDILNFSRVEAGQVSYEIGPVSLSASLDSVLLMVDVQATTKGLRLSRSGDAGVELLADRAKLEQILLNLLANAVKFTEANGSIVISSEARDDRVFVSVTDTGVGIPADKLEVIFEPFVQVGRSLTSAHEGTGLGLAISRDLARAMGGELRAESTVGRGSTFTLSLPGV
jgi:PAS domain S-box-containing protein